MTSFKSTKDIRVLTDDFLKSSFSIILYTITTYSSTVNKYGRYLIRWVNNQLNSFF